MSRGRRAGHGGTVALVVGLLLVAVGWVVGAVVASDDALHDAPVLLVGPDVVTAQLVAEVEALEGHPVRAGATENPAAARAALEAGRAVAALEIDLAGTRDTLRLAPDHAPDRDDALVALVRSVEEQRGRTVEVVPGGGPHVGGLAPADLALLGALAGFLLVLVVSLAWGPFARTLRRGLARQAGIGTAALAAAAVVAVLADARGGTLALVIGAVVVAAGGATLLCEALAGLRGLLVAALLVLVLPLPLVLLGGPLLLAEPWAGISGWTVVGAGADAAAATGLDGADLARPVVVLGGTVLLAWGLLLAARWAVARPGSGAHSRGTGVGGTTGGVGAVPVPRAWRAQLAALALVLVTSTTLVLTVWSRADEAALATPLPSLAATTECVASGEVQDVDGLNRIAALRGTPAFQGGDVGASATLQDGRTVWMFGDTLRGDQGDGARFVRNSMLLVEPGCLRVVLPRDDGAIVPDRGDRVGYWPMSVVAVAEPGYDLVTVTAQRVHTVDADDPFGFEALGPAVAVFVVPLGGTPQLVSRTDVGADDADTTSPMWGAAASLAADGWLYLWGTSRPADPPPGTGFALRVARVRADAVGDPARWTYWDGLAWQADASTAAELVGSVGGVSQTLSVFERDGVWYAFSKRDEVLGQDLVFWTAPAPQGPFTATAPVAQLPSDVADGRLRYMPLAHPDLFPQPGTVVVSYSRNSTDVGDVLADPLLYRPRFVRVALPFPALPAPAG
ncbi:hypothetical protein ACOACO_03090 [Nocardioides sp. CPCC 205120]|uniref:hypothetical protein n=1 Tax=Nocardioides sp. CPCC 205120 TaxID=3406462 RepID=UPI003B50051F